ncbi:MAG: MATE family efflux transporter [Proteobacteria bacterium]|nr:MATE family efflux transporter [Pseudomonadota bacterium]
MSWQSSELRAIGRLAGPAILTQAGTMLMGVVDTLMVSRVGTEVLAAAAIANVWSSLTLFCSTGLLLGMDPLVSQAHGAGYGRRAGIVLQQGVVVALALTLPVAGLFLLTEPGLVLLGQKPELAAAAHAYLWVQLPSIPCLLVFTALRQYLQGRTLVRPAMWLMIVANGLNALANWALIFGNLGLPALGLVGAGIATSLVRVFLVLGLWIWVVRARLHAGAWVPWSRRALDPAGLRRLLSLGLPVALQLVLEIGAFSGSTLLAGLLSVSELGAHTIALNLASLSFMLPLGIAIAASTRAGNLLGAGQPERVRRSARVAFGLGAGIMLISAGAFIFLPKQLARLYTSDPEVVSFCVLILPIAGAFQIFDGTQVVACGVLRGVGRTRPAAWAGFVGYWLFGLPLGAWLAFSAGAGVSGIWTGLAIGLAGVAVALLLRVLFGRLDAQR